MTYQANEQFAAALDKDDPIAEFRSHFHIPQTEGGSDCIYFAGNSLGLQPRKTKQYVAEELDDWARLGVEGHWAARKPWLSYHENLTDSTARLVGAKSGEVVVMNTLTTNLHLMMVSFYRPTKTRYKILIESNAFPSDQYAVNSQAKFHGFDPAQAVVEIAPRKGESLIRPGDILELIEREGDSIALVMLGDVNYLTGQAFDIATIAKLAHEKGCLIGLNLAHGAGNLLLDLHDWTVDFAVWCSYKYLNAGPGGLAGCFVHERHANDASLPRFCGWWGHNKATRFKMAPTFDPIPGAEGWQLSNPPILQLAALRASMELFDRAGMVAIRRKGDLLTGYLEYLLERIPNQFCRIITPREQSQRGCQLSVRVKGDPKQLLNTLNTAGAICDFREPDIIRVAPAPLFNTFSEVYRFAQLVQRCTED
jgi:kynureninase